MKMRLAVCCLLAAVGMWADHDDDQYREWMKSAASATGSLRKNIEAKNGSAASADAMKAHEAFGKIEAFWKKKNAADAVGFAKAAGEGIHMAGQEAAAGKFDEASASLKKASGNCSSCHSAHREKAADGSWKIKH